MWEYIPLLVALAVWAKVEVDLHGSNHLERDTTALAEHIDRTGRCDLVCARKSVSRKHRQKNPDSRRKGPAVDERLLSHPCGTRENPIRRD